MDKLTIAQIITWTGARLLSSSISADRVELSRISCDSRKIKGRELFIALRGERFDGHQFIRQALERGASAVMVDCPGACSDFLSGSSVSAVILQVNDTLKALQDIAAGYRGLLKGTVIAVTGSVGKTSTRQMIAACLTPFMPVHQPEGNQNNEIGLPQTILKAAKDDPMIVLEMGMRGPGEIGLLSRIARPDISVITGIGWSHIGRLGSREAIRSAKMEVIEGMTAGGPLLLDADDAFLMDGVTELPGRIQPVFVCTTEEGRQRVLRHINRSKFALYADSITLSPEETCFTIEDPLDPGFSKKTVRLPLPGLHHVRNVLFGLAAARILNCDLDRSITGAASFQPVDSRQKLLSLHGLTIMDDSYNAAPESMEAALETLSLLAGRQNRKIAALGCMLELGSFSSEAHRRVGEHVAKLGFDLLLAYGPEADDLLIGARSYNPEMPSCVCSDHAEMAERLAAGVREGDYILVKGSRTYTMEKVITLLSGYLNGSRVED
jgi:UDP-N-acetylmuramoyl-tripeptide--D-alanyl-D-alanine ligase